MSAVARASGLSAEAAVPVSPRWLANLKKSAPTNLVGATAQQQSASDPNIPEWRRKLLLAKQQPQQQSALQQPQNNQAVIANQNLSPRATGTGGQGIGHLLANFGQANSPRQPTLQNQAVQPSANSPSPQAIPTETSPSTPTSPSSLLGDLLVYVIEAKDIEVAGRAYKCDPSLSITVDEESFYKGKEALQEQKDEGELEQKKGKERISNDVVKTKKGMKQSFPLFLTDLVPS